MKLFNRLLGAALVAMPILLAAAPSEAATARQYQAQGHGRFVSSKGRPLHGAMHRGRGHHRAMHHRRIR
ncbi:hypothetical protein P7D22_19615 [Lichenihabitans sp. Uapishka_5]|uniref:hypothetical protein n=1 Tax=Lichenihabitans sp. Uapishka_5 TaxID=3037302 RepID=UPI0029E7CD4E|nr:hypothetical protein [Lichenihabitans sp. Uapishka_5]MDX7953376.1 hypothetical protein [Lichenihabitans sp. Uapishka_5]